MRKLIIGLIVFFNVAMLSGCAVFDSGKVARTTLSPVEASGEARPSISYSILAQGGLSEVKTLPDNIQAIIEKEFIETLQESGYFSGIGKENGHFGIRMDVTVTNTGNPAAIIPAFITGLSFYTIPSWATDHFEVKAKVASSKGSQKEYVLNDSTTLVQWLPMLFVFPFKNLSVIPEVRKNMYRNIIMQMREDGFLPTHPVQVSGR